MRGLTDDERSVLTADVDGPWEDCLRLIARGLVVRVSDETCHCRVSSRPHGHVTITAAGKLALELDTIARSGKVEV